jgi:hypothetical protein
MEELKEPPRAPTIIKLVFLLLCVGLGAVVYWVFIANQPPPPPRARPVKIERSKALDHSLGKLSEIRKKDFAPLGTCWDLLARQQTKHLASVTPAQVKKACPALKGAGMTYQAQCKDNCATIELATCKGGTCTPVEGVSYFDFVQTLLVRIFDGHNRLMAQVRSYERVFNRLKSARKRKAKNADSLAAEAKKLEAALEALLSGSGIDHKQWHNSYIGMKPGALYAAAAARVKELQSSNPAAKTDEPKKTKKRRRKAKKAEAKVLWGGVFSVSAKWPAAGLTSPSYRPLHRTRIEFFDGGIPQNIEKRADEVAVNGHFNFTPATLHFWMSMILKPTFHRCAARYAKSTSFTIDFQGLANAKLGMLYVDTVKVKATPSSPELENCLTRPIRKNDLEFGIRGLSQTPDKHKVHFKIKMLP